MAERLSDAQRRRLAGQLAAEGIPNTPSGSTPGEAALMVAGSMAGPVGARIAQYSPKALAAMLAMAGMAAPSEANEQNPYDRTMRDYTTQQAAVRGAVEKLKTDREALVQAADIEGRNGKGPKWQAAQRKVSEWDHKYGRELQERQADLESITRRMDAYDNENSPAAVRKRNAEMPTNELYPGATTATQHALAAIGLATSMAMRGRHVGRHNAELKSLTDALEKADKRKNAAEASAMTAQIRSLDAAGPSKSGTLAPAIAGFELGAFAPTAADYYRSGGDPNSPLYKKAVKSVVGGEGLKQILGYEVPGTDMAARMIMAGLLGAGARKIGNTAVDAAIGQAPLPRAQMVRAEMPRGPNGPNGPAGSAGSSLVPPGVGGQGGQQVAQQLPTPPPTPKNPRGPGSSQPHYGVEHSQLSQQYIDDVLASGQGLPQGREMASELSKRYAGGGVPEIRPPDLTRRANLTKSAIEAGADPKTLMGKAGFLAVPGAMIGSAETIQPELLAEIVRQLSAPQ